MDYEPSLSDYVARAICGCGDEFNYIEDMIAPRKCENCRMMDTDPDDLEPSFHGDAA